MGVAIELRRLTKYYGRRRGVIDLGVQVEEGEVFGFLGPNGAGKTTTIRLLVGLIRPTSGSARVFGLDAWRERVAVHRRLAYVGSDPGFLGELTPAELLTHLARLRGLAPDAWRRVADRLELDTRVTIRKLSHGNRQKVGVVQVFMGEEPLLVMDEPTTGLDPLMQRQFLTLVSEARAAGRTVFLSSHNLPEVERSCDRVGIIREGRLTEISSVQALLSVHWRSVNLVLGVPAPTGTFALPNVRILAATDREIHLMIRGDVKPILERIARLDVRDVAITTPDIEDVFLRHYDGQDEPEGPGPEDEPEGPGPEAEPGAGRAQTSADLDERVPEEVVR
jgi:ABC-2 type transport system ATP-binding protein